MNGVSDKENLLFYKRLSELCDRCKTRYCPEFTSFLDGRLLKCAKEFLATVYDIRFVCFGGFQDSERCCIGIFPADIYSESSDKELFSCFDLSGVEISGSGFSDFSHSDVMGAVLSLGIKRETMGDIYLPENENRGFVCLTSVAAAFVCENLEYVARDKVKCNMVDADKLPAINRRFTVISGTVASDRLDCVVALSTRLSRDKAKNLITSGFVNVNHEQETRCDVSIVCGDILSIRGYGRYVVSELGDLTRKGRNKTVIHKMV